MADFKQVIQWLKEGKKVRRPCWKENSYWIFGQDQRIMFKGMITASVHLNQINADDWEIYKEKKELIPKTLKELVKEGIVRKGDAYMLKQDAIKHLKYLKKIKEKIKLGDRVRIEIFGKETWIKHFFNIKEEDLK